LARYPVEQEDDMEGQIHAIVIGNEKYKSLPAVAFAIKDARAFYDHITRAEVFPVQPDFAIKLEDVSLTELGSKMRGAFKRVQQNDSVIMYYAGHGLCEGSRGFLLPVEYGADPSLPPNPNTNAFGFEAISAELQRAKPRHFVLILDSCHSGAAVNAVELTRKAAEQTRDLAQISIQTAFEDPSGSRIVVAACTQEQQARGVADLEHGLFTHYLLEGLGGAAADMEGRVKVDRLYEYVEKQVTDYARAHSFHQMPIKFGRLAGAFYLPSAVPRIDIVNTEDVAALIAEARERLATEQFENARELVEEGLKRAEHSYDLRKLLRQIEQAQREQHRKDETARRQMVRRQIEMLLADAENFEHDGNIEEALAALREAEKLDRTGVAAARREALEMRLEGVGRKAAVQLRSLFDEADALVGREPARALELYRQALAVYPGNERAEQGIAGSKDRLFLFEERSVVVQLREDTEALNIELEDAAAGLREDITEYRDLSMPHETEESEQELARQQSRLDVVRGELEWLRSYEKALAGRQGLSGMETICISDGLARVPQGIVEHPEGGRLVPVGVQRKRQRREYVVQKRRRAAVWALAAVLVCAAAVGGMFVARAVRRKRTQDASPPPDLPAAPVALPAPRPAPGPAPKPQPMPEAHVEPAVRVPHGPRAPKPRPIPETHVEPAVRIPHGLRPVPAAEQVKIDLSALAPGSREAWERQQHYAHTQGLPVELAHECGIIFRLVPPGEFEMGSEDGGRDEKPVHRVRISRPFWVSAHEVTVRQYAAFLKETVRRGDAGWSSSSCPLKRNGASYVLSGTTFGQSWEQPMVEVSWEGAQAFCRWLNRKTGATIRLPTEAEWEYACRAGTSSAFCYGNDLDSSMASFDGDSHNGGGGKGVDRVKTMPVGQFKPNAWGLYDMHGNVWEWCEDWYGRYRAVATMHPAAQTSGSGRVVRGGSWNNNGNNCRSAYRNTLDPELTVYDIGLRVVLSF